MGIERIQAATGAPASIWKPYPAYKDSGVEWLGKVPEHWVMKKIKWIFKVINGSTPKTGNPEYWDGDIPWITPDDLGQLHSDTIYEPARKITESGYKNCGTTLVPIGSLVLSTRAPIGHLAIAGIDLCTNQGCRALVFKNNDNARYFYYQLSIARPELESWGQGSTFRELSKNKLESFELFSPEVEEQHSISLYLVDRTRKIDSLIEKKQKMIELLKEERTATINQAVTKGLNPDVPMKDSGIEWLGEIPKHWEIKRLKYVAEINRNTLNENTNSDYEFQYIDIGNVTIEGLTHPPQLMKFKDAPSRARRVAKKGDTIVSTVRTYLKAIAFIENKADNIICSTGFAVLTSNGILNSKYLYYFMINEKIIDLINSLSTGISYPAINSSDLANIVIWFPKEIKEQQEIINLIEYEISLTYHTLIKMEKEIELLEEYRTSLISEVVTGKVDVREAA